MKNPVEFGIQIKAALTGSILLFITNPQIFHPLLLIFFKKITHDEDKEREEEKGVEDESFSAIWHIR